jgi:hypothetical protein
MLNIRIIVDKHAMKQARDQVHSAEVGEGRSAAAEDL